MLVSRSVGVKYRYRWTRQRQRALEAEVRYLMLVLFLYPKASERLTWTACSLSCLSALDPDPSQLQPVPIVDKASACRASLAPPALCGRSVSGRAV